MEAQGRELKLEDFDPQTGEAVYRARTPGTASGDSTGV